NPSSEGSLLDADHPSKGVPIPRRITVYYVDDAGDVVVETDQQWGDAVITTLKTYVAPTGIEIVDGASDLGQSLTGSLVTGASGNDTITVVEGGRAARGLGGDDILRATTSATLAGNDGNDTLVGASVLFTQGLIGISLPDISDSTRAYVFYQQLDGGAGNDLIQGGSIQDFVTAGADADTVHAGAGRDRILGEAGDDVILGEGGVDSIWGGDGLDLIDGGLDDDFLFGEADNDSVRGGQGNDALRGDAGADSLWGDAGDDSLNGGADDDRLAGSDGKDTLDGGTGADTMIGGTGDDLYLIDDTADVVTENSGEGYDVARISVASWTMFNHLERAEAMLTAGQTINGSAQDNRIVGNTGADSLNGANGNDVLDGGLGNDRLDGGAGNDTARGGAGADAVIGGAGDDSLEGNDGDDRLRGDAGRDTLLGGAGADTLEGGDDADRLRGDVGADVLSGGSGDDTLTGGEGADTLTGGAGKDAYYVSTEGGTDTVTDFSTSDALIIALVTGMPVPTQKVTLADNPAIPFEERYTPSSAAATAIYDPVTGRILVDADGSGAAAPELMVTLANAPDHLNWAQVSFVAA
ncbi:MAG: hypothetical protein K2X49_16675, partial [Acetobacteraceae bacterium]|nr:hypothetical protein [Acetobacteraceae bacterium]